MQYLSRWHLVLLWLVTCLASPTFAGGVGGVWGYAQPLQLSTGTNCHYHEVADLNSDGRPDILVPTRSANTILIFLNTGTGAFSPGYHLGTIQDVLSTTAADMDRNGTMDVLAVGYSGQSLRIHWGVGDGTFTPTGWVDYPLGGLGCGIVARDLNGDGWCDVAITRLDALLVFLNNGTGGLLAPSILPTPSVPYFVTDADIDGDGDPDLLVSSFTSDTVASYRNDGILGFTVLPTFAAHGSAPCRIAAADVDANGLVDLFVPFLYSQEVAHFEANGTGGFGYVGAIFGAWGLGAGSGRWAECADLDMDGRVDVACCGTGADAAGISLQSVPSALSPFQIIGGGANNNSIRIADMDGNGSPDIVISAHDSGSVVVLLSLLFVDCNANGVADSQEISGTGALDCNGNHRLDECELADGTSSDCNGNGRLDECDITQGSSTDSNGNGIPDDCERPFCFGDGLDTSHTTPCPCGNNGGPRRGCANSVTGLGAALEATGTTVPDAIVLEGSAMPSSSLCIYLQGDILADATFGDGVRCTGGNLIRLRTKANVAGASRFPEPGDISVSSRGQVIPGSGARRYYQTYYRNPAAAFCPPETFNVTNGCVLDW